MSVELRVLLLQNNLIDLAKQSVIDSVEQAQKKKNEYDRAVHIQKLMEAIANYSQNGWVLHLLATLDKEKKFIESLRSEMHPILSLIDQVEENARVNSQELFSSFPAYMEKSCISHNYIFDRDSRHPKYKFDDGFFTVEVDKIKRIARITNDEIKGKLAELSADPDAILVAVKKEHDRVFERNFEANIFLKELRQAYLATTKKNKRKDGDSIPIREVVKQFSEGRKNFRSDEFLIDLSRLLKENLIKIDNRQLQLQQSRRDDEGSAMLLHDGRGYVGFVMFKEIN